MPASREIRVVGVEHQVFHGRLHLGVHRFHGGQAGGLGGLDAQGPGHVDGVAEDIRLFRQGGGDVQAAVGADEQPVQAGDLQNDQVAGQAGGQGVLHGQQGVLVIGGGHGDALAAVGQGCLQQLVKIADLFHSGRFLSYM